MDYKDFFISYNKADKAWAKWVAGVLEEHNYTTYLQAWDIRPGNDFISMMNKFLECTNGFIPVFSEDYINSPYCKLECSAALDKFISNTEYRFLPVRVSEANPPDLIRTIVYIDIFDTDEAGAERRLLHAVDKNPPPRPRPSFPADVHREHSRPPFPILHIQYNSKFNVINNGSVKESKTINIKHMNGDIKI